MEEKVVEDTQALSNDDAPKRSTSKGAVNGGGVRRGEREESTEEEEDEDDDKVVDILLLIKYENKIYEQPLIKSDTPPRVIPAVPMYCSHELSRDSLACSLGEYSV